MKRSANSTASSPAEPARSVDPAALAAARAVYVHSPFCARRCPYCDFAISPLRERFPFDRFLAALDAEAAVFACRPRPRTLYIGGGTPTALPPAELERFFAILHTRIATDRVIEFTVEANPEDVDVARARILADAGVDRVSLGAQSFDPASLRQLGRAHKTEHIVRAVDILRTAGVRAVNIDLIFAIPGQDAAALRRDVDACLRLSPEHVSLYGLTFEAGTSFTRARDTGRLRALDSDAELALQRSAIDRLADAGLDRYEVSNFARPGHRSRHNLTYWRNESYVGLGPSAVTYVGGVRRKNAPDVRAWCDRVLSARDAAIESEHLEPARALRETLMLGLRLRAGIRLSRLRRRFGALVDAIDFGTLAPLETAGLVVRDPEKIRLTSRGLAVADGIAAQLI